MSKLSLLFCLYLFSITNAVQGPAIRLNDGNQIPVMGLGTYGSAQDIARMRQSINWAIEAGYRHIDTAALYRNEEQVGQGIADVISKGIVRREDIFVTTKLWNDKHGRNQVVPALRESLRKLRLSYVDLYLIHFPQAQNADGSAANIDYLETWQGMEEAKRLGLAKSIGVSNFNTQQIDRIIANSNVVPAVNQIEVHPSLTQEQLVQDCKARGIVVTAYSPFGFIVSRGNRNTRPPSANDPALLKIANKYRKSVGQIVLRYLLDRNLVVIPKSTNRDRIYENINVFDFKLTPEEISIISRFNTNTSIFG